METRSGGSCPATPGQRCSLLSFSVIIQPAPSEPRPLASIKAPVRAGYRMVQFLGRPCLLAPVLASVMQMLVMQALQILASCVRRTPVAAATLILAMGQADAATPSAAQQTSSTRAANAAIDRIIDRAPPDGTFLRIETGVHAAAVRRIAVSPDRRRLLTASDDKTARVWDLADGSLLGILRARIGAGETGRLYGAAIHPTEDLVAIGGSTGSEAGKGHRILLHKLSSVSAVADFDARGGDIKKLAWSTDGSLLFAAYAGDNAVRAFDRRGTLRFEQRLQGPAYGLATSATGLVAVASFDGGVTLLRAAGGRVSEQARLVTGDRQPVGVAFSPDGGRLVVGYNTPGAAPEVFDVASARSMARLESPPLAEGNRMTVAWSADGSRIAVGGTGHQQRLGFPVFVHDASTLKVVGQFDLARDSILDLAPIDGQRFAWGAFDGSWGVIDRDKVALTVNPAIPDLREPSALLVSDDAQRVAWNLSYDRDPVQFDFRKRALEAGAPGRGLSAARTSAGFFSRNRWQNVPDPVVSGKPILMEAGELSRALANFATGGDTMLATSRHLMRIDASGAVRWRVRLGVEARAVVVAADDRVVVTGMADGSLRWWQAENGKTLLTLLATRDGKWIAWTPEGYFDASTGADRLIGWAVNRDDRSTADFHSVARFRERFNRPAEIDEILRRIAPPSASTTASTAAAPVPPSPASSTQSGRARPAPVAETPIAAPRTFPPVLEPVNGEPVRRNGQRWQIPFTLRSADPKAEVEVRIDGRPTRLAAVELGAVSNDARRGVVVIEMPGKGSLVQLLAKNASGVSEPLTIAAPPAAAPTITAPTITAPTITAPAIAAPAIPAPTTTAPTATTAPTTAAALAAATQGPAGPGVPAQASPAKPRLFVLSIGISKYQRPEYALGLAAKDASDFARQLGQQKGRIYREVITRELVDQGASRSAVLAGLEWLSDSVTPDDVGIVFMAGHGVNAKDGVYYFLPWEANLAALAKTAVSESALRSTLGKMRGKALLFVDTCFGGDALSKAGSSELARVANDLSSEENGVIVFASSSSRQLSEENDAWGNGAFTKAVIAGLAGKADLNRSGRVTVKGLDFYVSEEVRRLTEGRQTPVSISPRGIADFTIARSGAT